MNGNAFNGTGAAKHLQKRCDEWELNLAGDFSLLMHHKGILKRDDWTIIKRNARSEFKEFFKEFLSHNKSADMQQKFEKLKEKPCIGTLLRTTGFLFHTPVGADYFRISSRQFYIHRARKLNELDQKRIQGEFPSDPLVNANKESADQKLFETIQVLPDAPSHNLVYQATEVKIFKEFELSNMGCYICQKNFENMMDYEEHIQYHNEDSDFQCLMSMEKKKRPAFDVYYQLCSESHFFCFTFHLRNIDEGCNTVNSIIVEKIIVVQARSIYYAHNNNTPFEMKIGNSEKVFIDSNLFMRFAEQPVIIVYHQKNMESIRFTEQHHFIRTEEFPAIYFSINPRRLSNKKLFKPKITVPLFEPTNEEWDAFKKGQITKHLADNGPLFKDYIDSCRNLTLRNYAQVFQSLLKIEDIELTNEYLRLSQTNVKLQSYEGDYILKLEKLDKHIGILPSTSDEVIITVENNEQKEKDVHNSRNRKNQPRTRKKYFGFISTVSNKRVTFRCDGRIPLEKSFSVKFRPNRSFLRYQFFALNRFSSMMTSQEAKRLLFPETLAPLNASIKNEIDSMKLEFNAKSIEENPEQLLAVKHIVNGPRLEAPFAIFGPPGTGKTTTLVEGIYQLYKTKPYTKILVTAGSNSACDEIALRLCRIISPLDDPKAIVRIYSRSNEFRSDAINELLLEHSNMYAGQFYPDIDILHEYRIIICTVCVVGKLITGKFGQTASGNPIFSHVIIDEAATLTEPESLVPIVFCTSPQTRLIIAGDYKQLSSVLHSSSAKDLGLQKSLLERIMTRECYCVNDMNNYDTSIQIHLVRNYRSHPEIVKQFGTMYYENRLLPIFREESECGYVASKWHLSPNPKYPIVFHSVFGQALQRQNSSSYYNREEIITVMDYVKDLMYFGINGMKVKESDIGIISPYKSQYLEIQDQLNLRKWTEIETGSVETFQGREKTIIIVSFVRSSTTTLGFLDDPRRLNVTLSRAKSFLVLIGNPKTLSLSEDFMQIMAKCKEKKTFIGRKYELEDPIPTENPDNNLKNSFNQLNLLTSISSMETTLNKLISFESNGMNNLNVNHGNHLNEISFSPKTRHRMVCERNWPPTLPRNSCSIFKHNTKTKKANNINQDSDSDDSVISNAKSSFKEESEKDVTLDLPKIPQSRKPISVPNDISRSGLLKKIKMLNLNPSNKLPRVEMNNSIDHDLELLNEKLKHRNQLHAKESGQKITYSVAELLHINAKANSSHPLIASNPAQSGDIIADQLPISKADSSNRNLASSNLTYKPTQNTVFDEDSFIEITRGSYFTRDTITTTSSKMYASPTKTVNESPVTIQQKTINTASTSKIYSSPTQTINASPATIQQNIFNNVPRKSTATLTKANNDTKTTANTHNLNFSSHNNLNASNNNPYIPPKMNNIHSYTSTSKQNVHNSYGQLSFSYEHSNRSPYSYGITTDRNTPTSPVSGMNSNSSSTFTYPIFEHVPLHTEEERSSKKNKKCVIS